MRLSTGSKLAFAVGDVGENFCWTFVSSFSLVYFTNVVGVNAGIVATLMMIARIFDGFTDVYMGHIIDITHHRMGKARPWLLRSIIPLMIVMFLMFNVPGGMSQTAQYAYIFITYTLLSAGCYTMSNVSYAALTALITTNNEDRVQMGSMRFIGASLAGIVINAITLGIVEYFGGGAAGWRMVTIIYCIGFAVFSLWTVFGVKELEQETDVQESSGDLSFRDAVGFLFKNKYFFLLLGLYLVWYLNSGLSGSINAYFAMYVLEDSSKLGSLSMAQSIPSIIGLMIIPPVIKRVGMRRMALGGYLAVICGMLLGYGAVRIGSFPLLLAGIVIKGFGIAPHLASIAALIAATSDYSYEKDGVKIAGTVFSCTSVGCKIGVGVGSSLIGWMLAAAQFDGTAAVQSAAVVNTITNAYFFLPIAFFACAAGIMVFMRVEEDLNTLRAQKEREARA